MSVATTMTTQKRAGRTQYERRACQPPRVSETVRQVEAITAGEIPFGAVNAERWTRGPVKAVP